MQHFISLLWVMRRMTCNSPILSAKNQDDLQPGGTGGQSHTMLLSASSGGAGIDAALPQLSQGDK